MPNVLSLTADSDVTIQFACMALLFNVSSGELIASERQAKITGLLKQIDQ